MSTLFDRPRRVPGRMMRDPLCVALHRSAGRARRGKPRNMSKTPATSLLDLSLGPRSGIMRLATGLAAALLMSPPAHGDTPSAAPGEFRIRLTPGPPAANPRTAGPKKPSRQPSQRSPQPQRSPTPPPAKSSGKKRSGSSTTPAPPKKSRARGPSANKRPGQSTPPAPPTKRRSRRPASKSPSRSQRLQGSRRSRPAPSRARLAPGARWDVSDIVTPRQAAEMRRRFSGGELELPYQIRFRHDSVRVTQEGEQALTQAAELLRRSPEIRLLLIEGHADLTGTLTYNQRLSETRAAKTRSSLIALGVAPERLIAYGFGETRAASGQVTTAEREPDRRVILRIIQADRDALGRASPVATGYAVVVGSWGDNRWANAPTTASASSREWHPLEFRQRLTEGVDIETRAGSGLLLRLPDLTRMVVHAGTRVRLTRLFCEPARGKAYTAVRLGRGSVRVVSNPRGFPDARAIFAFRGGSVEVEQAEFTLWADDEGSHLTVDAGIVHAATGSSESATVTAMQALHLRPGASAAEVGRRLPAPVVFAPVEGGVPHPPAFSWNAVPGAIRYELELAEDVDFYQPVLRQSIEGGLAFTPARLPSGKRYFWRVTAIPADKTPGMASAIHLFSVSHPPGEPQATALRTPAAASD